MEQLPDDHHQGARPAARPGALHRLDRAWSRMGECADIGTMATDGRSVWFNPDWCEGHGVEKTMGVIAHEVLHVVNKHHLRRGERDAELWNVAADLLINRSA